MQAAVPNHGTGYSLKVKGNVWCLKLFLMKYIKKRHMRQSDTHLKLGQNNNSNEKIKHSTQSFQRNSLLHVLNTYDLCYFMKLFMYKFGFGLV